MKHNNSGNAAYLPPADYYGDGGYLGYDGQGNMAGCRRLFFILLILILMAIAGGVLAVVL